MERSRQLIYILWPSFLMAVAAVGLFFSLVAPADLHLFGEPLAVSDMAAYTIGFFLFWALTAASSALTCFLLRGPELVNRGGAAPVAARSETDSLHPIQGEGGQR